MADKLNVQFNGRQTRSIEDMAEEMGTTEAGVIKTALFRLQLVIRESQGGHSLGIIKGDRVVQEITGIL
jgi:hypothetical protein